MVKSVISAVIPLLMAARMAAADCASISYTTCDDNIVHWFNPDTGEVCDPLPCGGGRAPLRTDVPGCDAYEGTEIYVPTTSYLSCWTATGAVLEPTLTLDSPDEETTTTVAETEETEAPESGEDNATSETTSAAPAPETTMSSSPSTTPSADSTFITTSSASITTPATTSAPASSTTESTASTTTTPPADSAGSALGGSFLAAAVAAVGVIVFH